MTKPKSIYKKKNFLFVFKFKYIFVLNLLILLKNIIKNPVFSIFKNLNLLIRFYQKIIFYSFFCSKNFILGKIFNKKEKNMISLKNKRLKKQKTKKLCKTHKMKRSRIRRSGKVKLNMTKVVVPRNFRVLRKKSKSSAEIYTPFNSLIHIE